eukprot:80993-Prymnesium_polylepis.2
MPDCVTSVSVTAFRPDTTLINFTFVLVYRPAAKPRPDRTVQGFTLRYPTRYSHATSHYSHAFLATRVGAANGNAPRCRLRLVA